MIASDLTHLHGPTVNDFCSGELDVYVAPFTNPALERFVGRTEAEKTFSPTQEWIEWSTGMPQVLYAMKPGKVDLQMKFAFMQIGDPAILGLAWNTELDWTDPGADIVYFGSDPPTPLECVWRFVTRLYDGRYWQLVIRRGIIVNPEDFVTGSGKFTNVPVVLKALLDDTICDKQRNIAHVCIERLAVPSGGYVDPCPSTVPACDPD